MTVQRPDPSAELRAAALELFARDGYSATSLQDIADRVGYAKANVLYHFGSKQGLFEAAVAPIVEEFERIASGEAPSTTAEWVAWADELVGFMLVHSAAVSLFINQIVSLREQPLITRVNALIFSLDSSSMQIDDRGADARRTVRRHIAIAGAAYCIAKRSVPEPGGLPADGLDDDAFAELVRGAVRDIVGVESTADAPDEDAPAPASAPAQPVDEASATNHQEGR